MNAFLSEMELEFNNAKTAYEENRVVVERTSGDMSDTMASSRIAVSQTTMQDALRRIGIVQTRLRTALDEVATTSEGTNTSMFEKKRAVVELRTEVEREEALQEVRRQQVKELAERDRGNYHSSWMGLMRPMKSESQTGLIIATVGFFILCLLGGYYAYLVGLISLPSNISLSAPDFSGSIFRGGKYVRRR